MQAKTIVANSQTLACYESTGKGRPVFFVHGNSSSGQTFAKQFDSPLGQTYHLVAIDLPGHGQSKPTSDPGSVYSLPGYALTVVEAARQLGVEDAVFAGWSLGGHIVLEACAQLPKAAGFMIYGTPPLAFPPQMETAFLPHPAMVASFKGDLTEEEMDAYVTAFFKPGVTDLPESFRADIRRTDGNARAGLGGSLGLGFQDEAQVTATLKKPLAVFHGEQEQLINAAYIQALTMPTLWHGAVQFIPDCGHAAHWEQPEKFNALMDAFVRDCAA